MVVLITCISLGSIALVSGLVLFVASKKFAVVENPLIDEVEGLLPGANCGGCGFAGCRAFAEKLVDTSDMDLNCPVIDSESMGDIGKLLGVEVSQKQRMVARVNCQGGINSVREGRYHGIKTCSAAAIGNILDLVCPHGCMGYGDCLTVCPYDCIHIINGVAVVDEDACVGCGICVKACPRNLIELTRYDKTVYVACNSPDKGPEVKKYCSVGCIGCKLCDKACNDDAIQFKPFLAKVNPDNCTECRACVEKCPANTILVREGSMAITPKEESEVNENVHV